MTSESVNRVIRGRYRLIAQLAVGGMGVTYRAWDLRAGGPVVLKMPRRPKEDLDSSEFTRLADRFAREVEVMRALGHDHIVPIVDHGDDEGMPFVAMRFLPGGALSDHRKATPSGDWQPVPASQLHTWLPSIAEALDFIHSQGIVHRDVKPANIFFDGFTNAFLGDFGIAKIVSDEAGLEKAQTLTATHLAIGTPEYMAPEVLSPKAVADGRADQYALAISVYELISGQRPFTGTTAHIVIEHASHPVPPLDRKGLGLPSSLTAAIERALAKKPEDRFPNCAEFTRAALADVRIQPHEPGVVQLLCPACRKVLRVARSAGGRSGNCPSCKQFMEIAEDFSALWLKSEASLVAEPPITPSAVSLLGTVDAEQPASVATPLIATPDFNAVASGRRPLAVAAIAVSALLATALGAGITHWWWHYYHSDVVQSMDAAREQERADHGESLEAATIANNQAVKLLESLWKTRFADIQAAREKDQSVAKASLAEMEDRLRKAELALRDREAQVVESNEKIVGLLVEETAWLCLNLSEALEGAIDGATATSARGSISSLADRLAAIFEEVATMPDGKQDSLLEMIAEQTEDLGAAIEKVIAIEEVHAVLHEVIEPLETLSIGVSIPPVAENSSTDNPGSDVFPAFFNSVGMKMILIPKGEFGFGANQEVVRIDKPFFISATEVTQGQFVFTMPALGRPWRDKTEATSPRVPGSVPASYISWEQATGFCLALTKLEPRVAMLGAHYSLPTEIQWEYACRAGSPERYCFGDGESLDDYAWFFDNRKFHMRPVGAKSNRRMEPVFHGPQGCGSKKPNRWGVYDMHGNVAEWCLGEFSPGEQMRVLRGGGWGTAASGCSATSRVAETAKTGGNQSGFRVVLNVPDVNRVLEAFKDTNTIKRLTVEDAQTLKQDERNSLFLSLNGLTTLSDDTAAALAEHEGGLYLNGLTQLSSRAVEALAKHKGGVLSLDGLTSLSSDVAKSLAQHEGAALSLRGLIALSDENAAALAQHKGKLYLGGLTALSDEAAKSLAQHEGSCLDLSSIPTLSDAAANAFSQHKGELYLSRVTTLSDEAARSLAQHKGRVLLTGLAALSKKAAAPLRANPEIQLPEKVRLIKQ